MGISLTLASNLLFVRNVIYEKKAKATKRHLKKISGCSCREHVKRWRAEQLLSCGEEVEKHVCNCNIAVSLELRPAFLYESSYVHLVGKVHAAAMAEARGQFSGALSLCPLY